MILAGMFIFLVILSHGQMTTANELKKLNERMGPAQLGVSPPTVSPPPYPVGVPFPPPNPVPHQPPPTAATQPKYEYLVDLFFAVTGVEEYSDYLNNKSNEGWELIYTQYSLNFYKAVCTFRKIVS
mgnify:CR=1 FL=1